MLDWIVRRDTSSLNDEIIMLAESEMMSDSAHMNI